MNALRKHDLKRPILECIEQFIKPRKERNQFYQHPPNQFFAMERIMTENEIKKMQSDKWRSKLKNLDQAFDENRMKEAY